MGPARISVKALVLCRHATRKRSLSVLALFFSKAFRQFDRIVL